MCFLQLHQGGNERQKIQPGHQVEGGDQFGLPCSNTVLHRAAFFEVRREQNPNYIFLKDKMNDCTVLFGLLWAGSSIRCAKLCASCTAHPLPPNRSLLVSAPEPVVEQVASLMFLQRVYLFFLFLLLFYMQCNSTRCFMSNLTLEYTAESTKPITGSAVR